MLRGRWDSKLDWKWIVASAVLLALPAGPASANLDLNETAAALALPVITDSSRGDTVTAVSITNASREGLTLAIQVIDGDGQLGVGYHHWSAVSFECYVTGRETTLFRFSPEGSRGSKVDFECSTFGAGPSDPPEAKSIRRSEYMGFRTGIMFVAVEQNGVTVSKNVLFGDWATIDYAAGAAYSAEAIAFQAVDPFAQDGDRAYRFDNKEYSAFPALVATDFIAPVPNGLKAELVLFTLDGTVGQPPWVDAHIDFFNDDELKRDQGIFFDCFVVQDLSELDSRFDAPRLGSPAGHLELRSGDVPNGSAAHDFQFGNNDRVRNSPFHGWLVQTLLPGGHAGPEGRPSAGRAQWARALAQSVTSHVPAPGDVVTLNAR